jgi:hypothetical protein
MKHIKKNNARDGYIMIFTLLVVAAAMVVVTYVGHRGSFYIPFSHMILAREKAKQIALGGIQVGIAQLVKTVKKEESKEGKEGGQEKQESNAQEKDFLRRILPVLNRWQVFDLKEEVDGIDAQMSVCIMCEDGKINLNRIIDFEKGVFRGDEKSGWKAIMQEICKLIDQTNKGSELFPAFEKVVKDAKHKFNDATELITHKEFQQFKDILFYRPPISNKQNTLYLTDIFTVWSRSDKLEPWLFSDSINGLFGLPRVEVDDIKKRKDQIEAWIKNFKVRANWQQDWQTLLMPIYGKELRTLPKNIDSVLKPTFAPQYFSILVDGKVDEVTQRVYAIVERTKRSQGSNLEYDIEIKKLYWL